jgi:chromosome segregation protein
MYIKELEIYNFKSFGKRVVIPFFDDFTTVSGPNGSGKSNIVDSVLFCLGLSSSRNMRAEKLTDLIFNGNGSHEAMVRLTFNNEDFELPTDSQLTIMRKLRRTQSGYYSYYYLNGKQCTLSDVHDLLSKVRITPEGYNVVMQGDITRITEEPPLERRKIIDEIAGVSEFDRRRDRAIHELEIVRERVERIDIILTEVEARLEQLKVEREQALNYQNLKENKRRYERFLCASKRNKLEQELLNIRNGISRKQRTKDQLVAELIDTRDAIYEFEEQLSAINDKVSQKGESEHLEIKKRTEEIKGEISRKQNLVDFAKKEVEERESQRRKALIEKSTIKSKVEAIADDFSSEVIRRGGLSSELEERKGELLHLKEEISSTDAESASIRDSLFERRKLLGEAKDERADIVRSRDRVLDELRRKSSHVQTVEREIDELKLEAVAVSSELETIYQKTAELEGRAGDLFEDIKDLEVKREDVKLALETVERRLHQAHQEYVKAETRLKATFGKAVEAVASANLRGIRGVVAELGKVDHQYAIALEVAAGSRMRNIIVDTDADAARAIDFLKSQNIGRVTFLPLNKMHPITFNKLEKREGIIDYAINLVNYNPDYKAAFSYVFGRTVIVRDLEAARKLIGVHRIATLDGELLELSGAMTGGIDQHAVKFVASEEEALKRLGQQVKQYDKERERLQNELSTIDEHTIRAKREHSAAEGEVELLRKSALTFEERKGKLEENTRKKSTEHKSLHDEKQSLSGEINELEEHLAYHNSTIESIEKETQEIERLLKGSDVSKLTEKLGKVADEVRRLEGRLGQTDTAITALRLQDDYMKKKLSEVSEALQVTEDRIREFRTDVTQHRSDIEQLEGELNAIYGHERKLEGELNDLRTKRDAVLEQISAKESQKSDIQRKIDRIEEQIISLDYQRLEIETKIEELIEEAGGSDIEACDEPYEVIMDKLKDLETQMEATDDVNMRAIEEYDTVTERKSSLIARRDTLFTERAEILERIDRYGQMKKEAFMSTFDGINANFKHIYADLSGGTGELALENYDDPFDGGLIIRSWQHGKHIQRLEGMSGGEKSLTALALIFAIQRYMPAPFYIFDEIDMFLDGANAEMVAKTIKQLSLNAQFIVVSLRKPMIEAANRTIGVSMQEGNISSITGVKLS